MPRHTPLPELATRMAIALHRLIDRHTTAGERGRGEPKRVPVDEGTLAAFASALRVVAAFLRLAPKGMPMRRYLAEVLSQVPVSPLQRQELKLLTKMLLEWEPNGLLDTPGAAFAHWFEVVACSEEQLSWAANRPPHWTDYQDAIPARQAELLELLGDARGGKVESPQLAQRLDGDQPDFSAKPMSHWVKSLDKLAKDTNKNLSKLKLPLVGRDKSRGAMPVYWLPFP